MASYPTPLQDYKKDIRNAEPKYILLESKSKTTHMTSFILDVYLIMKKPRKKNHL
jgi:hypothetical protein